MNDETLRKKLQELAVPPVDEAAREKALYRARIAFQQPAGASDVQRRPLKWKRAVAPVAAVVFGLLWFVRPHASTEPQPSAKLLTEMEALFPGQVDAVILKGDDVSLDLSATPAPRSLQPLVVTLSRGSQTVQVLAYSGSKVCVQLDGRKECFETLVTAEGKVILSGDDFIWNDDTPRRVAGYRVQARSLSL